MRPVLSARSIAAVVIALAAIMVLSPFAGTLNATSTANASPSPHGSAASTVPPTTASSPVAPSNPTVARGMASLARGEGPANGVPWTCSGTGDSHCGPAEDLGAMPAAHAVPSVAARGSLNPTVSANVTDLNWTNQSSFMNQGAQYPNTTGGAAVAYDPDQGLLVLLGGGGCLGCNSNSTWIYDGYAWYNITAAEDFFGNGNPLPLLYMSMAWDPQWDGIIVTGGLFTNLSATGTTWLFGGENETWWNITSYVTGVDGAPDSAFSQMAYDDVLQELVIVNGCPNFLACDGLDQTFVLGGPGSVWSYAGVGPDYGTYGGQMAFDRSDGYMVYFGGAYYSSSAEKVIVLNDTWIMTSSGWSNISTSAWGTFFGPTFYPDYTYFGSMTWDGQIGAIVMYGGYNASLYITNQTYEFSAGEWYPAYWFYNFNISTPPADVFGVMPVNCSDIAPVLIGGSGYGNLSNSSWVLEIPPQPYLIEVTPNPADVEAKVTVAMANAIGSGSGPDMNFTTYNFFGNYSYINFSFVNFGESDSVTTGFLYAGVSEWLVFGTVQDFYGVAGITTFVDLYIDANVTAAPTASAVEAGNPTVFTSAAANGVGPYSYAWDFGDDSGSAAADPSHTYSEAGTYTVTLNVTDAGGGYNFTTFSVTVYSDLEATASANVTATDTGHSVQFTGGQTGGKATFTYAWAFGDTGTSASESPTHTYTTAKTYVAYLNVTDSLGYVNGATVTVVVNPTLTGSVSASTTTPHTGSGVTFTGTPIGGTAPFNYTWTFGDGGTGYGASPSHSYGSTGTYNVTVVIKDAFGETATEKMAVTVSKAPSTLLGDLTSGTGLYALIAVILIVLAAIALLAMRRRKREPAKTPPAAWNQGSAAPGTPAPAGQAPPPPTESPSGNAPTPPPGAS